MFIHSLLLYQRACFVPNSTWTPNVEFFLHFLYLVGSALPYRDRATRSALIAAGAPPGTFFYANVNYIFMVYFVFSLYANSIFMLQVDTLFEAMDKVTVVDRPPSIFQCQLKLFNEWYDGWSPDHKRTLYESLTQIDSEFMSKLNETVFNQSTRIA